MTNNRDQLKTLIKQLGYTRKQTAEALSVPLPTLNNWLAPETSKINRRCPDIAVKLLNYILEKEQNNET